MKTKTAEKLWKAYPGWHLHCEVNTAGLETYQINMSMFNRNGELVGTIEYYGSGELTKLKDEAFQRLLTQLEQPVE